MRATARGVGLVTVAVLASACGQPSEAVEEGGVVQEVAEGYVKLVLAVGRHDPDYVDAYYGPPAWKAAVDSTEVALDTLGVRAGALRARLAQVPPGDSGSLVWLRLRYLDRQLSAVGARVAILQGRNLPFDVEAQALYDATPPRHDEAHFQEIIDRLDPLLPGRGSVVERYQAFRRGFIIPADKIDTVFQTAIQECRARTAQWMPLPEGEAFTVEYVTDKPWSGYNWYQGAVKSLIQVNVSLPIYIDRAVDLACHEGYPGHHVYNASLESALVRGQGWVEYTVYPLFSPQSLIAEGTANFGIRMAFPEGERAIWERDHLFALAGLNPSFAEDYYKVQTGAAELSYAGNEAARRYLDGEITGDQAADWLERYALFSPEAAAQRVKFIDRYRSYVINYNLGQDLVKSYIDRVGGTSPQQRWAVFSALLASPRLPGDL